MAKLVEDVYGGALFDLALEESRIDEFYNESKALSLLLEENPDLVAMMTHPQIDEEEKEKTLDTIFEGRVAPELLGLMHMVLIKGHFTQMQKILDTFIARVKDHKNIGVAHIATPMELSASQKKAVEEKLLETTDYTSFEMNYTIQPDLIGGMVIRIKDRVVDSSIKTKLAVLKQECLR